MSKHSDLQKYARLYRQETGNHEVDARKLAEWLLQRGYPEPTPISSVDRIAKDVSAALREETRIDEATGEAYRANHVYTVVRDGSQLNLWVDIDEASREPMHASLTMRREQIVGDICQLTFDADHWNRINPHEEPIQIEPDFALDLALRRRDPELPA